MDRQSVLRIYVYETAIVVLGVLFLSLGLGICLTSLVIFFEGRACTMLSEELGSVFFFAALEREVFLIFIIAVIEILWKGRKLAGINLADLL
jgi:hypothetical protein